MAAAFCAGHGKKGCGAGGFVCKGHFVGAKVAPPSASLLAQSLHPPVSILCNFRNLGEQAVFLILSRTPLGGGETFPAEPDLHQGLLLF